jgi:phage terminase large subunit-like protein
MWYSPDKYDSGIEDVNSTLLGLEGELEDKQARISLAKFLRNNLTMTTYWLTGIKLAPYQEIMLKGFLNRNFSMCVWGRGCGKTFIASIFCFLQCIFEPNTKILIAGPTFRTARFIFNNIKNIVETKEARLLAQAFGAKTERNDQHEWKINGGTITAIPLNGEKVRGFRANVLVLDEFMLIPEETIKNVLMPFLVSPQDLKKRLQVREQEDELIKKGKMEYQDVGSLFCQLHI